MNKERIENTEFTNVGGRGGGCHGPGEGMPDGRGTRQMIWTSHMKFKDAIEETCTAESRESGKAW